jgi:hypothetical protein
LGVAYFAKSETPEVLRNLEGSRGVGFRKIWAEMVCSKISPWKNLKIEADGPNYQVIVINGLKTAFMEGIKVPNVCRYHNAAVSSRFVRRHTQHCPCLSDFALIQRQNTTSMWFYLTFGNC